MCPKWFQMDSHQSRWERWFKFFFWKEWNWDLSVNIIKKIRGDLWNYHLPWFHQDNEITNLIRVFHQDFTERVQEATEERACSGIFSEPGSSYSQCIHFKEFRRRAKCNYVWRTTQEVQRLLMAQSMQTQNKCSDFRDIKFVINWDSENEECVNQWKLVISKRKGGPQLPRMVPYMAEMQTGVCQLSFRHNPSWEPHPGVEIRNTELHLCDFPWGCVWPGYKDVWRRP